MRYFSNLPLHAYGTVPQFRTSGAVAASAEHYTPDCADGARGLNEHVKETHLPLAWLQRELLPASVHNRAFSTQPGITLSALQVPLPKRLRLREIRREPPDVVLRVGIPADVMPAENKP